MQIAVNRGVGPPGAQVSLEQQAYMLLTEPERQTMAYYLQEYHEGHIGVQPLTMALFELFNTHAKVWQQQSAKEEVGDITFKKKLCIRLNPVHSELYDGIGVRAKKLSLLVYVSRSQLLWRSSFLFCRQSFALNNFNVLLHCNGLKVRTHTPWEKSEAEGWHPVSSIQKLVEKLRGSNKNQADKAGRQKKE